MYGTIVEHFFENINTFSVSLSLTILEKVCRIGLLPLKRRIGLYEIPMQEALEKPDSVATLPWKQ